MMARSSKTVASRALLLRPFSKVVNRLRRAGPRFLLALAVLAFLTSTVLQTLICFGFPKYKHMIFYRFDINTWQSFRLSMWSVCAGQPGKVSFAPSTMADIGQPEVFRCQETPIGWKGSAVTENFFSRSLSQALLLHPLAIYFSAVGAMASFSSWKPARTSDMLAICASVASVMPVLAFLADALLFTSASFNLTDGDKTLQYLGGKVTSKQLGLASWLALASAVVSLLGSSLALLAYWERIHHEGAAVVPGTGRWLLRRQENRAFDLPLVGSTMTTTNSAAATDADASQTLLVASSGEKFKVSPVPPSPEVEEGYGHSFSAFALQQQQHQQQLDEQSHKLDLMLNNDEPSTCTTSRVSSVGLRSNSNSSGSGSSGSASRSMSPFGSPR